MFLNTLELAIKESAPAAKEGRYRTVSLDLGASGLPSYLEVPQKVRPERPHVKGALRPWS